MFDGATPHPAGPRPGRHRLHRLHHLHRLLAGGCAKLALRRPCSADSSRVGGPKAGKGREGGGLLRNRHPTATAEARGSLLAGMGLVSLIMWVAIAAIARVVIKEVFGKKK